MLEIVKLKNPFDRTRREAERVAFVPGQVLTDYIPDQEVVFVLNSNFVEQPELTFPCDGDQIIVLPHVGHGGFKGILGMVASIALSVYAGNVAVGKWGGLFAKGTLGAVLASGAVMYVGGRIINAVFPVQQKSLNLSQPSSPTYGWDTPQPVTGEGGVIGITYGECIPAPQVLERHVETVNGQQYLNLLLCGGIGPVDSIANIKIGSTPIENFQGVQIETRLGTNDQTPISFFTDTPLDQAVNLELSSTGIVQTSDSKKAVSLEVTVEFPGGLYHINDKGNFENSTVVIRLEYRLVGATTWAQWQDWSITAAQNTAVRKSTRITGLDSGQYEARATILSRNTGSRDNTFCSWSVLTAYNPGQYARPNKVLLGLRILATNQLSGGIPDITWRQVRNTVYVWNPQAQRYEAKSARNPIWAAYDIYHQCRYMKNSNTGQYEYVVFGVDKNRLSAHWDEWVEAAAYADEQVAGLDGTPEHRFEFDAFYDIEQKRYDAAQKAANVGHAVILPRGNNIGIKCDKPGQMVQIFGEGRTTLSSLNGTFTGTKDRALAVEVVYTEQNNDFKNTQFLIRSPKWNTATDVQDNPAELQLFGVKRRSQAYREGVYTLANNELVTQFIDIDTDIDALVCEYGDLVGLNHTVPQIGIQSGRIAAATMNTVTLDKMVDLVAGESYELKLQLADDSIITKQIVSSSEDGTTDILTVSEPFTVMPQSLDNYVFGETGKSVKPFRLVGIEKDGDLRCKLNLAEYMEGVYAGDLNYPIVDYTPPGTTTISDPIKLSLAEENYLTADGLRVNLLHIAWDMPKETQYDSFAVWYSLDGYTWKYWETTPEMSSTISSMIPGTTCYVKIQTLRSVIRSPGVMASLTITGTDALPPDVDTLFVENLAGGSCRFTFALSEAAPVDLAGYRLRYNAGNSTWWNTAIPLHSGLIPASPYETNAIPQGTITILAKAVDNAGNESENAAYAILGLGDELVDNVVFTHDFSGFSGTKTGCHVENGYLVADDAGGVMYPENLASPMYPDDLSQSFYQTNWNAMAYEDTFTPDQSGTLSFSSDIYGNARIFYRQQYPYQMYGREYDRFYPVDLAQSLYREGPWLEYTGKVDSVADIYQVRVEIAAGTVRGTIRMFLATVDVPDISETINDLEIPPEGCRLPITKKYIRITNVNVTLQEAEGTKAQSIRIDDKDQRRGPLKRAYDKADKLTASVIDAKIEGY